MRRASLPARLADPCKRSARPAGRRRQPRGNSRRSPAARTRGHYRRSRIRRTTKRSPGPAHRLMRFLVDAQLPPALARWLAANGHTAEHVADRQLEAASDVAIWDCALRQAAAIITKDEDFALSKALSDTSPAVVWIRLPNTRRRELSRPVRERLPDILSALERARP